MDVSLSLSLKWINLKILKIFQTELLNFVLGPLLFSFSFAGTAGKSPNAWPSGKPTEWGNLKHPVLEQSCSSIALCGRGIPAANYVTSQAHSLGWSEDCCFFLLEALWPGGSRTTAMGEHQVPCSPIIHGLCSESYRDERCWPVCLFLFVFLYTSTFRLILSPWFFWFLEEKVANTNCHWQVPGMQC